MPNLPEAIWQRRLESEFEQMREAGVKFDCTADKTRYVVSLHGPGLARNGDAIERREVHTVQIDLLRSYPYPGGIEIVWLTPIFHPNIREQDGIVCIQLVNQWAEGQTIASVVNALKQLLENPNPKDPLNREAADYFIAHPDALSATTPVENKKPRIVM